MWLHPGHREAGGSTALLAAVQEWALRDGAATLMLWVTRSNQAAAGSAGEQDFSRPAPASHCRATQPSSRTDWCLSCGSRPRLDLADADSRVLVRLLGRWPLLPPLYPALRGPARSWRRWLATRPHGVCARSGESPASPGCFPIAEPCFVSVRGLACAGGARCGHGNWTTRARAGARLGAATGRCWSGCQRAHILGGKDRDRFRCGTVAQRPPRAEVVESRVGRDKPRAGPQPSSLARLRSAGLSSG